MAETINPLLGEGSLGSKTEVPILLRGGGGGRPTPIVPPAPPGGYAQGLRAYHGSPHDFERFDVAKIGSGEGAQVYGRGLYFAEHPNVAKAYKEAGPGARAQYDSINSQLSNLARQIDQAKTEYYRTQAPEARTAWDNAAKAYDDLMATRAKGVGKTYEVNIRAKPEEMLDLDKPLSEQSPSVKAALESIAAERAPELISAAGGLRPTLPGQYVVDRIARTPEGAEALHAAGIKGIRYLDQGSRGEGKGTSNYVVFNDQIIDILKKYGIAGLMAPGIVGAALPMVGGAPDKKRETPQPIPEGGYAAGVAQPRT